MNQKYCSEISDNLIEMCQIQYEENSKYIQEFIRLRNELIDSTSQLVLDYKTLNCQFLSKIKECDEEFKSGNEERKQNLCLRNNVKEIMEDYQMADNSKLHEMEQLLKQFQRVIESIEDKHFINDKQVQILNFENYRIVTKSLEFQNFQEWNYQESEDRIDIGAYVIAAEISPDETHLICISYYKIIIWDYLNKKLREEFKKDTQMLTFTFVEPSSSIIIGDKKGMIHQIYITDQVVALTNEFQAHNDEIYFILVREKHYIYTCSKDNTIKLINTYLNEVMLTIISQCPCQHNFAYSEMSQILIAPNGNNISIYDSQDGKKLDDSCYYGEEQEFLAILLSVDCSRLYMNLYSQTKINIYNVNCLAREINLTKIINLYTYCYNISLCFNDQILVLLNDVGFEFRHLQDDKIPLIKEISVLGTGRYLFNKQHPNLNKLLSLEDTEIIVNERIY
ncbi:hypothetical protein pb186bvf_020429 [Paramecium bursaria]